MAKIGRQLQRAEVGPNSFHSPLSGRPAPRRYLLTYPGSMRALTKRNLMTIQLAGESVVTANAFRFTTIGGLSLIHRITEIETLAKNSLQDGKSLDRTVT